MTIIKPVSADCQLFYPLVGQQVISSYIYYLIGIFSFLKRLNYSLFPLICMLLLNNCWPCLSFALYLVIPGHVPVCRCLEAHLQIRFGLRRSNCTLRFLFILHSRSESGPRGKESEAKSLIRIGTSFSIWWGGLLSPRKHTGVP